MCKSEKKNIYEQCPEYETPSLRLRLVSLQDSQELLDCYSDKQAVAKMNADGCTSRFYCTTPAEMETLVRFWLAEYGRGAYVRFAVLSKAEGRAVGTVEIGGASGVLRIDLATRYEEERYIQELLRLVVLRLIRDFQAKALKIKVSDTPRRIPLLESHGFARCGADYYERRAVKRFCRSKGVAACGLACCVCGENGTCAGCRMDGCKDKGWCKSYRCHKEKGLEGCWSCEAFPCDYPMLAKPRVKAFAAYIARFGADSLMDALKSHEENGVLYHYAGQLTGDYELLGSEEETARFLTGDW